MGERMGIKHQLLPKNLEVIGVYKIQDENEHFCGMVGHISGSLALSGSKINIRQIL